MNRNVASIPFLFLFIVSIQSASRALQPSACDLGRQNGLKGVQPREHAAN
uniref:Uncharacterized protein n=1 Tax=Nelumbo nucifera TaxID=4432 RepID=A0A822XIU0_NELNU|nr:TPA_asm: hypothetical protein HUJ06_020369 [Nelumbo nucifera]